MRLTLLTLITVTLLTWTPAAAAHRVIGGDTITGELVRQGLVGRIAVATEYELKEQQGLRATEDVSEGIHAVAERRGGRFKGR